MNGGRGTRSAGYTIVETLIFLAVSAAMFLSAMVLISGRQGKSEFNSAVRDFDSSIQDIANDVSDGYYSDVTNDGKELFCQAAGVPVVTAVAPSDSQGTNKDCIFVGKAIQFAPRLANDTFITNTMVGLRQIGGVDVASLAQAQAMVVAPSAAAPATPDASVSSRIQYGAQVVCAFWANVQLTLDPTVQPCSAAPNKTDIVAFTTTFSASTQSSGTTQVDVLVPTSSSGVNRSPLTAANDMNALKAGAVKNPVSGVYVCLQSGGTNQRAIIQLAGRNGVFSNTTVIQNGAC